MASVRNSLVMLAVGAGVARVGAERANPIRKVVTLLQKMQERVIAEGEKEQKLYDEFMCQCKKSGDNLASSSASGTDKVAQLGAATEKVEEEAAQNKEDLAQAQADRVAAKKALAEAAALREKESSAFASDKAEHEANLSAMKAAIEALTRGVSSSFLQSTVSQKVQKLAQESSLPVGDRESVVSFLSGETESDEFGPSTGEIIGMLKQMTDQMTENLREVVNAEDAAIVRYEQLVAARTKELAALQKDIEERLKRNGDLAIKATQMKNDQEDTQEALAADAGASANLQEACKTKKAEFDERVKTRGEELAAVADTIKMLNSDEALEMFKKSGLQASSSFLQVQVKSAALRARAVAALHTVAQGPQRAKLDLIALALAGKSTGFEKVVAMVNNMVATLKAEQGDDDKKKENCGVQLDSADDSQKALERQAEDSAKTIATILDDISTARDEIASLKGWINNFERNLEDAGRQRAEENAEYKELMANDGAAKELILHAKKRLNKFYNPSLALVQKSAQRKQESHSVLDMMDSLIRDVDKEMTEAEAEEKNAQAEYDSLVKNAASKKEADAKALIQKQATLAQLEKSLDEQKEAKGDVEKELAATKQFIHALHLDCDFLLKYYDYRKEARTAEVESLERAKDILNGADYSLVQVHRSQHLRGVNA